LKQQPQDAAHKAEQSFHTANSLPLEQHQKKKNNEGAPTRASHLVFLSELFGIEQPQVSQSPIIAF